MTLTVTIGAWGVVTLVGDPSEVTSTLHWLKEQERYWSEKAKEPEPPVIEMPFPPAAD